MQQAKTTAIGTLVDVTAEYFAAHVAPAVAEKGAVGAAAEPVQVGAYLSVRHADLHTLAMVERVYRAADKSGRPVLMVRMTPLGEIGARGEFNQGISRFPAVGSELHPASRELLARVFSSHGAGSFQIGKLTSFSDIGVHLDASAFFGRHAAILGQSGSGKSWTVTSLVQSALRSMPEAHIILLDVHGEYCDREIDDLVAKSPFSESRARTLKANELEFPYWLLSYSELCELLIDPADVNAGTQTSFIRSLLITLKRETNKHLDLGHITVDSPVYYSLEELLRLIRSANSERTDFGKTESPLYGKFDQLLVRFESLLNDSRYDFMLKPRTRTSTESLVDLMKDLVGLGTPSASITVIDISVVPFDVLPMVTAQIGRLSYEFNFWNPQCREFPIFLICEEAHEYIPRENIPRFREARRSMERISKNGRKYGVGICVVSQRPHDVSETLLAQCSSYICLRISNPDDQEYLRAMVPDASRGTFADLASLSKGEAVALGEAVPMPVRFRVDLPNPPPNSMEIDYAGMWSAPDIEISVEKLVNNWHNQLR